jgi:hypothetical protein
MKNNKYLTIVLLAASAIIWGTIAWRVYQAFNKKPDLPEEIQIRPSVIKADSVRLLLNYDDPFLGKSDNKTKTDKPYTDEIFNPEDVLMEQQVETVSGPAFKFKGVLKSGKNLYGLLDFQGETIMIRKKDKIGDFYIVDITAEKVVVRREGLEMDLFAE